MCVAQRALAFGQTLGVQRMHRVSCIVAMLCRHISSPCFVVRRSGDVVPLPAVCAVDYNGRTCTSTCTVIFSGSNNFRPSAWTVSRTRLQLPICGFGSDSTSFYRGACARAACGEQCCAQKQRSAHSSSSSSINCSTSIIVVFVNATLKATTPNPQNASDHYGINPTTTR